MVKRKISISEREEKLVQENIEKEKNKPKEEEKLMNQMSEFMNSFEIPHILKSRKKYYANTTLIFLISTLFSFIFLVLFKSFFGGGIKLIVYLIILTVLITITLKKLKVGKIVEFQADKVILSIYPKMNFGIFRVLVLIQIAFNLLEKIEIKNKNISEKRFNR